ncbi:hypothetical protein AHAS_Ahas05G0094000 [Arachis hypogaea]
MDKFMLGFSNNLKSYSIMQAKLWDIIKGFQIVVAHHFNSLVIEFDSSMPLTFVKSGCPSSHSCKSLLKDIKIFVRHLEHVTWLHIPRKGNSIADIFAKKGQELPLGIYIFEISPDNVNHALLMDSLSAIRMGGHINHLSFFFSSLFWVF